MHTCWLCCWSWSPLAGVPDQCHPSWDFWHIKDAASTSWAGAAAAAAGSPHVGSSSSLASHGSRAVPHRLNAERNEPELGEALHMVPQALAPLAAALRPGLLASLRLAAAQLHTAAAKAAAQPAEVSQHHPSSLPWTQPQSARNAREVRRRCRVAAEGGAPAQPLRCRRRAHRASMPPAVPTDFQGPFG